MDVHITIYYFSAFILMVKNSKCLVEVPLLLTHDEHNINYYIIMPLATYSYNIIILNTLYQ